MSTNAHGPPFDWTASIHLNGDQVAAGGADAGRSPGVTLAGDLARFRGFDIWQIMQAAGASGCLRIVSMGLRGEVYVDVGRVIAVWARPHAGRLGAIVSERGAVTREELRLALNRQIGGGAGRLGELLVEAGSTSEREIDAALVEQRQRTLAALLLVPAGRFAVDGRVCPDDVPRLDVDVQALVLERLTRLEERVHRQGDGEGFLASM